MSPPVFRFFLCAFGESGVFATRTRLRHRQRPTSWYPQCPFTTPEQFNTTALKTTLTITLSASSRLRLHWRSPFSELVICRLTYYYTSPAPRRSTKISRRHTLTSIPQRLKRHVEPTGELGTCHYLSGSDIYLSKMPSVTSLPCWRWYILEGNAQNTSRNEKC